jgi:hypothetical protein
MPRWLRDGYRHRHSAQFGDGLAATGRGGCLATLCGSYVRCRNLPDLLLLITRPGIGEVPKIVLLFWAEPEELVSKTSIA